MNPEGIDVSQWQGAIDWDAVAAAGVAYAWAKVSEGVGFEDPNWSANAGPLAAPGPITAGAYHFARPDLGNTPEAEADWFWSRLTARVPDVHGWLLALDLEAGSGPLGDWRDRWCARVSARAGGAPVGWYANWQYVALRALNYPSPWWFWFAWPDGNGAFPGLNFPVSFQQYGTRSVPGIGGQVDADRFFGNAAQLAALTVGGGSPGGTMATIDDVMNLLTAVNETTLGRIEAEVKDARAALDNVNVITLGRIEAEVKDAAAAAAGALAALKAELDLVESQIASATPPDLTALKAAVADLGQHLGALGTHLGVGTA